MAKIISDKTMFIEMCKNPAWIEFETYLTQQKEMAIKALINSTPEITQITMNQTKVKTYATLLKIIEESR